MGRGVDSGGELRYRGSKSFVDGDVEVSAELVDSGFVSDARLGALDLDALVALAVGVESAVNLLPDASRTR